MKKHMLIKEFFIEIKKSSNRFLSILLIVLLGVAFFSGIRATSPDMKLSADTYFDNANLMDIRIVSSLGLTEDDIQTLSKIKGVDTIEPAYSADVFCNVNDQQLILRLTSMTSTLNQVQVTQGRMPQNKNECLVDTNFIEKSNGLGIGDTITVTGEEDTLDDTLDVQTFTIVGTGNSPYYLSLERGTSTIGTGQLTSFVLVPESSFCMDVYTEADIRVAGASDLLCYTDAYTDCVKTVTDEIDNIDESRCDIRYATIQADGKAEIADAQTEIKDSKQKLADAQEKLADGKEQITDGWDELAEKERELTDAEETLNTEEARLQDGQAQLDDGYNTYYENEDALNAQIQTLNEGAEALQAGQSKLDEGITEYNANKAAFDQQEAQWNSVYAPQLAQITTALSQPDLTDEMRATLQAQQEELLKGQEQIAAAREKLSAAADEIAANQAVLDEKKEKIENGAKKIEEGRQQLSSAWDTLEEKQQQLNDGAEQIASAREELETGKTKLVEAKQELRDKEQELTDAQKEYDAQAEDANHKIADAEEKLEDAQIQLEDLKVPTWYILDRNSIQTYVEYGQDADRIAAIGNVFPVIFFLVAALICLTTMTRMVEENRMQIGTLKALGYTNGIIASKYVMYALMATLFGSVIGTVLGQKLLPVIIIKAYRILYNNLPIILAPMHNMYSVLSTALAVGCTVFATLFACYRETISMPAKLMRPEAPKSGKRILMERITFIWKRLSFTTKATFRNLFRYKKRFFMTVFGIGGCMGLLLVGYGLKDSIMAIGTMQYGTICLYNSTITLNTDTDEKSMDELDTYLQNDNRIDKSMDIHMETIDAKKDTVQWSAYLMVPQDPDGLNGFVNLHNRLTEEQYELDDTQVIITEKLAKLLSLSPGDTLMIKNGDTGQAEVKVGAVTENYFYHYIYMAPALYEQLYGEIPEYNQILLKADIQGETEEKNLRSAIMDYEASSNVTYVSTVLDRIETMLQSMNSVIYVIVIAAGLLAFVVLYNLNNINISERKRELATLKVLGFYETEVSQYVLRENIWLTLIGCLVGVGFGWLLHRFLIVTAEIDIMMFGRDIYLPSYLISIGLTFVFSALVNIAMHFKLKKIDMVESMKSVE